MNKCCLRSVLVVLSQSTRAVQSAPLPGIGEGDNSTVEISFITGIIFLSNWKTAVLF